MAKTKLQFYFLAAGFAFLAVFGGLVYRKVMKNSNAEDVQYKGCLTTAFWFVLSGMLDFYISNEKVPSSIVLDSIKHQ